MRKMFLTFVMLLVAFSSLTALTPAPAGATASSMTFKVTLKLRDYRLNCDRVVLKYYDDRNFPREVAPAIQQGCTVTFKYVAGDRSSRNPFLNLYMEGSRWKILPPTTGTPITGSGFPPAMREPTWWERQFAGGVPNLGDVLITATDRPY